MQWETSTSCLDPEISTVTDTFTSVCTGQWSASRLTSWRSTSCWAHCCTWLLHWRDFEISRWTIPLRQESSTCGQIHLPHATFSHVQSLHKSHSTNACVHWFKSELCSQNHVLSMRHVSPSAAHDTEHLHKFSLPPLLCCCRPLLVSHSCRPRIRLSTVKVHGGWYFYGTHSLYRLRALKDRARQNQIIDDQENIEEIGVKSLSHSQSLTQSAYDPTESIATPPELGPRRRATA